VRPLLPFSLPCSRTWGELAREPLRWRSRGWATALATTAAIWTAYVHKWQLDAMLRGRSASWATSLSAFVNVVGSGVAAVVLAVGWLLAARLRRSPRCFEGAVAFASGGVCCWVLTELGRFVLAERRPIDGGTFRFLALGGHGVSGHAAAAALLFGPVVAVALRGASPRARRLAAAGLLLWIAFVGYSRVALGMHFAWNVLLGFAIGAVCGRAGVHAVGVGLPLTGASSTSEFAPSPASPTSRAPCRSAPPSRRTSRRA
jgi:membrane-associated phospholipid phosphatase